MLALASCSSRIVADQFFHINKEVLDHQPRPYFLQNKTQHDVDHPISFKEGAYLKTGYYRFTK
jgi:23S rRNA (cytosine1962-C5)-methyltransferase